MNMTSAIRLAGSLSYSKCGFSFVLDDEILLSTSLVT